MEIILWSAVLGTIGAFSFVLLSGAPYVPTLRPQITTALQLSELKQGQILLELGSGDGRVLFAAAEQGIHAIGYELNPLLVLFTKIRARKYKGLVEVHWANFWSTPWPECDVIFVFLLDKYMEKLDKKIVQEYKRNKIKLISFAFAVPDRQPARVNNGVYLYHYN